MVYSIFGWIYESILCSLRERRLINRGFLNGPYCPIYGFGAIIDIFFLGKLENPISIFLLGALLACSLEYFTSWAMEKLFHARWWDYSSRRFNIKGRICLLGAVVFGMFAVVLLKVVHPVVYEYTYRIEKSRLNIISTALFLIFFFDTIYTIIKLSKFEEKLKELTYLMNNLISGNNGYRKLILDKIKDIESYGEDKLARINILKKLNFQERRILKAFPKLKSLRYNETLQKIREFMASTNKK
jgi:uncharacterized membrane protein